MRSIQSDLSIPSIVAKLGYSINPESSIYNIRGFTGFHQTASSNALCHFETANTIVKRNDNTDNIVLLGSFLNKKGKPFGVVMHSILVDSQDRIIADSNSKTSICGEYIRGKGYFFKGTSNLLFKELLHMPVAKLIELTQKTEGFKSPEIAKVDPVVLDDALKNFYFILAYATAPEENVKKKVGHNLPSDVIAESKKWDANTVKFCTQFGIKRAALGKMLKAARDNAPWTDEIDSVLTEVGRELYAARPAFDKDISIPADRMKMLKDMGSIFKSNSQTAMARAENSVSLLRDPKLSALFTISDVEPATKEEQDGIFNEIKKIVKKVENKSAPELTPEAYSKLKIDNPELFKRYQALRRQAKQVANNFIADMVRRSGKEYLPIGEVISALNKAKLAYSLPKGFVGNIDEKLNLRTVTGLVIQGGSSISEVQMNPKYDPELDNAYVFKAKTAMGEQRVYTLNNVENKRGAKKEQKLKDIEDNSTKIRGKWLHDLQSGPISRKKIMAAECEIMYVTGARTGNPGNSTIDRETGERIPTFGITTLQVKDVTPYQGGYRISYNGKKLSTQDYIISNKTPTNKKIIALIKELTEGKDPEAPLWTDEKGKAIPTLAVAQYFKSLGAGTATLHSVRHLLGTKIAREVLKDAPFKKGAVSQSQAESWYKDALKKVGEALVHTTGSKVTSMTAIKSYISPNLQKEFFKSLGLRTPSFLEIKGKGGVK